MLYPLALLLIFIRTMSPAMSQDTCSFSCVGGMKGNLHDFPVPANTGLYGRPGKMGAKGEPGKDGKDGIPGRSVGCTCDFKLFEKRIIELEKLVQILSEAVNSGTVTSARSAPPSTFETTTKAPQPSNPSSSRSGFPTCATVQSKDAVQITGNGLPNVYNVRPPELTATITAACDITTDGGGWMIIQQRNDGSSFFKTWNEYVNGFGPKSGSHWLGLKYIEQMVRGGKYELRIDLTNFNDEKKFAKYKTFKVAPAGEKYRLILEDYDSSSTLRDDMASHVGMKFTTSDNDNDPFPGNCAEMSKGGWWYRACHSVNLNGVWSPNGYGIPRAQGITWLSWTGFARGLKATQMKIRRKP